MASASVSALSASFLSELSVCSSANVGTPNCACSHVLTTEPVSPIQTIGSEDTNVYTYGVTKFTLAYSGCDTFPVTNPSLTCYTDNTYTILKTCILVEVAETATVYEVTIGDGVSTFTNTNVGNQYVRLTASSDYGMSGYVDFYFTITYTITACEQGYTGTDSCTDPCGYNYDGIETCSPCSDTYDDGPYAGLETCGPCDDGYAATNPDPVLDCTPCTDRYDQSDM